MHFTFASRNGGPDFFQPLITLMVAGFPGKTLYRAEQVQNVSGGLIAQSKHSKHISPLLKDLLQFPVRQHINYSAAFPTCHRYELPLFCHPNPSLKYRCCKRRIRLHLFNKSLPCRWNLAGVESVLTFWDAGFDGLGCAKQPNALQTSPKPSSVLLCKQHFADLIELICVACPGDTRSWANLSNNSGSMFADQQARREVTFWRVDSPESEIWHQIPCCAYRRASLRSSET